jgi:hypothetical protein
LVNAPAANLALTILSWIGRPGLGEDEAMPVAPRTSHLKKRFVAEASKQARRATWALPLALPLAVPLALGACVAAPPTAPTVMVMPGQGKTFAAFQADDAACRGYASARIGGASPAAAGAASGLASAAVGTGLGAAAGAAIGSVSGQMGAGAAIGAASGLLLGSLFGLQNSAASAAGLQSQYNMAYAQCMAAKGNRVPPGQPIYPGYYGYGAYPWYPGYYPGYYYGYP